LGGGRWGFIISLVNNKLSFSVLGVMKFFNGNMTEAYIVIIFSAFINLLLGIPYMYAMAEATYTFLPPGITVEAVQAVIQSITHTRFMRRLEPSNFSMVGRMVFETGLALIVYKLFFLDATYFPFIIGSIIVYLQGVGDYLLRDLEWAYRFPILILLPSITLYFMYHLLPLPQF
jgi:hypothetical protein